jgi:flagellar hook-associated protein 3 FlgL
MTLRISAAQRLINHQRYLSDVESRMDQIQQQLATGRKIARASDDPAGAALALQHRKNIGFEAQMRRNIDGGLAFMNASEAALDGATESLQRARELAIRAANDTHSPDQRQAIALEFDQIIRHVAQVANTRFGDAYIFSGHKTNQPAFDIDDSGGALTIQYQGDDGARMRRISFADEAPINVTGDVAFGSLFDDLIDLRETIASAGSGTEISARIDVIDDGMDRIMNARADIGARVNRFESAKAQSEVVNINLQELRAGIEEVDLSEAIVELYGVETSLQAALGAIGRTNNMTLLNFLH